MDAQPTEMATSVGQLLRKAREASGISLTTVAHQLRISVTHLTKLENDHESLTCDVYTLGFLRLYAKYLHLNPSALIDQFKGQITAYPSSEFIFPTPLPTQGTPQIRVVAGSLLLFFLLAGGLGYYWWKTHLPPFPPLDSVSISESKVPPPSAVELQAPLPAQSSVEVSATAHTPLSLPRGAASPSSITLKATKETWVEVRNLQGTILLRRLLFPGESYEFKEPETLTLTTGNAQGIELISGEKTLTFPGIEVKREISLNPETWSPPPSEEASPIN